MDDPYSYYLIVESVSFVLLRDVPPINPSETNEIINSGMYLGLIMYILSTLEFSTHNLNFHLLTTSVNAKYYY